ncbi:hypothetical protein KA005_41790 [bacterium]|nr:hypothetical protein [bacterium]
MGPYIIKKLSCPCLALASGYVEMLAWERGYSLVKAPINVHLLFRYVKA